MSCAIARKPEAQREMEWIPQAVNPAWLHVLLPSLADTSPVSSAIDLEGAKTSEQFPGEVEHRDGSTWYRDGQGGYIVCQYVGRTSRGVHVFRVDVCYGGSGVFADLLFVVYEEDLIVGDDGPRKRRLLRSVGSCVLGEGFEGCLAVDGDFVLIRQHRKRVKRVSLEGVR